MKLRITALLIALCCMIPCFAACASGDDPKDSPTATDKPSATVNPGNTDAPDASKTTPNDGSDSNAPSNTDPVSDVPTEPVTDPVDTSDDIEYEFPELNCNGEVFTIFNSEDKYNMIMNLTSDGITGDNINDAIFANNALIEKNFNVIVEEYRCGWDNLLIEMQADIAGDKVYDAAYVRPTQVATLMTTGSLVNLMDHEDLIHLDQVYWDQNVVNDATLFNKYLYYATSDANLMAIEGTWCIYFNMNMFDELGLDYPYDKVRSNTWTLNDMFELAQKGADLKGDTTFNWDDSTSCVYGISSQKNFINALMSGCNEMYCKKDSDGKPYYALGESKTVADVMDAIKNLTSSTSNGTYISHNTTGGHYVIDIFAKNRSLMTGAEIKSAASEMNSMDSKYGMVPMPKYNADQKNYVSNMYWGTLSLIIPTTVKSVERSAMIMDAMSYLGYKNTLPEYYVNVSYKGLQDDDSIEMLQIIRDTRYFNWAITYDWISGIEPNINTQLDSGKTYAASVIAASKISINKKIAATLEALKKITG